MRKSIRKKCKLCLLVFVILCLCTACAFVPGTDNGENNKGESKVELTQRQIEILESVGLPTDYEELLNSQKHDIMAIEEMLCYLENTYKTKVEYDSFYQGSTVNNEMLKAKVNGEIVTVERFEVNGELVYQDDYAAIKARPEYENKLADFFTGKGLDVKVFSTMQLENVETENLLAKVNGEAFVFLNKDLSYEELKTLTEEYAQWYIPQLNGLPNVTRVYSVSSAVFAELNEANYLDHQKDVSHDRRIKCIISLAGTANIK